MLTELSLCYSIVYHYNVEKWYEQFLQIGRLDWALILLDLAIYLSSTSVSLVLMVLYTGCGKIKGPTAQNALLSQWF